MSVTVCKGLGFRGLGFRAGRGVGFLGGSGFWGRRDKIGFRGHVEGFGVEDGRFQELTGLGFRESAQGCRGQFRVWGFSGSGMSNDE